MRRQRGLSFLGLIVLVGILGFAAVIGLKLIPIYMDSWKIDGVMSDVISDPDINEHTRKQITDTMLKRLDINTVEAVTYRNYKEKMTITKKKDNTTINIYYRVETPLIGNLSLIAEFDKTVSS
jgi:Tfp pilus assembly major pilin PilA